MSTLLVRGIGELCTCDPARGAAPGVVRDAAVLAHDGVVTFAGPEGDLPAPASDVDLVQIEAGGAAVLPGFVDAHTHIVWLGDRSAEYAARAAGVSYEQIAREGGGIAATVAATAGGTVEELTAAARIRARRALRGGTTTIEVKSGYGLTHEAEMRQLDAGLALRADPDLPHVVTTYLPLHAAPADGRERFLDDVCTRGVSEAASRARFVDAFCEPGAFSVEECARVFTAAQHHGLRVKVHAEQRSHSGGARLAARMHA
ncbi:MAG: amidohydrolase family protein, partial [Chloroflexi bacterium]|nr:amidohydrolase family protein [Chloroflexota bacterium]